MFLVAMAFHPEVQEKAQKEIDDVIGPEQLASSEDRDRLPYIQALILETFRWKPVVPLITPHATVEDDEYKGYLIPKSSAVIAVSVIKQSPTGVLIFDPFRRTFGKGL